MAKFLTGNELNSEVERLFENANELIVLISPYIKLHQRYAATLKSKLDNPRLKIIVVFGKNEDDFSKSMKHEDFNFFKAFPNVEVRYEKRLHAKYYANESSAVITSMNLYSFSQDNNIEAGVYTKKTLLENLAGSLGVEDLDQQAWQYFDRVIDQSELLFKKTPQYEKVLMGLSKKYNSSVIEVDTLSSFFENSKERKMNKPSSDMFNNQLSPKMEPSINVINAKLLSTTALSRIMGISSKDLFYKLENQRWIEKNNGNWILTPEGIKMGGQIKKGQYGEYIAWPENVALHLQ